MKITFNRNIINKFALLIIPLLFLFWLIFPPILLNRISFSILTFQTKNLVNINETKIKLYKGEVYKGEFKSRDNNLGIIIIKIDNYKILKNGYKDILVFRFREKGKSNWEHQMQYASSLFDSQSYFPFGIPKISDSKNRSYQFELLSTKGDRNNPLNLTSASTFITGYQYSKQEIFGLGSNTLRFIYNKFFGFITDVDLLLSSLVYLIPLVSFVSIYFLLRIFHIKAKAITISFNSKYFKIFVLLILLKIISPKDANFDAYLIVLGVWIYIVINYKLKSNISFILSLTLLIFWIAIIPFEFQTLQKNLNIFIYMFFASGCLQLFYEEVKSIRKQNEKKKIK